MTVSMKAAAKNGITVAITITAVTAATKNLSKTSQSKTVLNSDSANFKLYLN